MLWSVWTPRKLVEVLKEVFCGRASTLSLGVSHFMNEITTFLLIVPASIVCLVYFFVHAKKVDRFCSDVRRYIKEKHPELKINGQPGFGFEIELKDRIYLLRLRPLYKNYKKDPPNFVNIIENALVALPFEGKSLSKEEYYKGRG